MRCCTLLSGRLRRRLTAIGTVLAEVSVVAGTNIHSTSAKSAGTRQALVFGFQPGCVPLDDITTHQLLPVALCCVCV